MGLVHLTYIIYCIASLLRIKYYKCVLTGLRGTQYLLPALLLLRDGRQILWGHSHPEGEGVTMRKVCMCVCVGVCVCVCVYECVRSFLLKFMAHS